MIIILYSTLCFYSSTLKKPTISPFHYVNTSFLVIIHVVLEAGYYRRKYHVGLHFLVFGGLLLGILLFFVLEGWNWWNRKYFSFRSNVYY